MKDMSDYINQYNKSMNEKDQYWLDVAKNFEWFKSPNKSISKNFSNLPVKCFEDGKLNITVNLLDRHVKTSPDKIAIIWESNSPDVKNINLTYKELMDKVCQYANFLKKQNVKKGDVVCLYMSMIPELLISALACARIGAVHSIVFGGFSANALAGRIDDSKSKIIITNDEGLRGDKVISLKSICDEAVAATSCVEKILVIKRTFNDSIKYSEKHIITNDLINNESTICEPEIMDSEDPLFILYTSGSTGKPKGLIHTCAGYMVWTAETFKHVFQSNNTKDIFWCSADIGWITGHSYMTYGPLLNGVSQIMFEGIPTWPDAGRFWNIIDKHKVTHFYTAPTAIRALQACDINFVKRAKLDSLKVLGSVGEPINIEAWNWYHNFIGKNKCPIVDTWWQTETGGIMISNLAGITPAIPCHATTPLFGVEPVLVNENGEEILGNPAQGNLCIKSPWPGIARSIFNDHKRYEETYFSTYKGLYFTGDGAKRDVDGNYRITGRVDDVINVSGHRIGTAEVENVINEHAQVIESAVVGFHHDIKGQGIFAYVIGENNHDSKDVIHKELNNLITKSIGSIAKIDKLVIASNLPKTRSGKIMRRILRKLAHNETDNLGDLSTLLNPECVKELIELVKL